MYSDTITKCSGTAARILKLERKDPLGFWISSAMAGAFVGLGIILIFTLGNLVSPEIRPLVMGAFFGIALTLVIIAGSELFTGHAMFLTFGWLSKEIKGGDVLRILPQTWMGNLLGSVLVAALFAMAGGGKLLGIDSSLVHKVALAKTSMDPMVLFGKAILCNWLVCLAIWMTLRVDGSAKFIAIWWCLLAFIASGYEHSIANMTVFAMSWFGEHSQNFTLSGAAYNLFWVSLGNTVSGALFMGVGYWLSTPKAERPILGGDDKAELLEVEKTPEAA